MWRRTDSRIERKDEEMTDLQPGDQIDIMFADAPEHSARAVITRFLSDQEEGLSPEGEDYILGWMEIRPGPQSALGETQIITFGADWKYHLDGREVKIRKCSEAAS